MYRCLKREVKVIETRWRICCLDRERFTKNYQIGALTVKLLKKDSVHRDPIDHIYRRISEIDAEVRTLEQEIVQLIQQN